MRGKTEICERTILGCINGRGGGDDRFNFKCLSKGPRNIKIPARFVSERNGNCMNYSDASSVIVV